MNKQGKAGKVIIIVGIILAVLALGVFLLARCARNMAKQLSRPSTATVTRQTISRTIDGSGVLMVNDTEDIEVPSEIKIKETLVEDGDEVKKGDIIATVDKDSVTSAIVSLQTELKNVKQSLKNKKKDKLTDYQIEELEARKAALNDRIAMMKEYHENPVVIATMDGLVYNKSSDSQDQGVDTSSIQDQIAQYLSADEPQAAEPTRMQIVKAADGDQEITDFSTLSVEAPVKGNVPQTTVTETEQYTGQIIWTDGSGSGQPVTEFAPDTKYSAMIMLISKNGYVFSMDHLPVLEGIAGEPVVTITEGIMVIAADYPKTEPESADPTQPADPTKPAKPTKPADPSQPSLPSMPALPSGIDYEKLLKSLQGLSGSGLSGLDPSKFNLGLNGSLPSGVDYGDLASAYGAGGAGRNQMNNTKLLTLAKTDTVVVKIYIDELDILTVSEGQKATVKLDAIADKEFEGTITSVGKTASSNAGTAKFIAEIEIPMDPQMRIGMTASVSIVIVTAENILTLPINAMQQTGDQMFVYRGYDEETMSLKDEQIVSTGLANKDLVEITEGLNEGDEVYYIDASNNPLAQYMMQAQEG